MTLLVDIVTIFPEIFELPLATGMLRKARYLGVFSPRVWNLRDFTFEKHRQVDDYPYGGGTGMVLKPEPIYEAIERLKTSFSKVILMGPAGMRLTQEHVKLLSKERHLIFIAGRYEGVDERVKNLIHEELSIGDYILTGGELPVLVVVDAISRLLGGVLSEEAVNEESFMKGVLDYPQYTRPEAFKGWKVPEVLLSGNHAKINEWRKKESLRKTVKIRPDLLEGDSLTDEEIKVLYDIKEEIKKIKEKGVEGHGYD